MITLIEINIDNGYFNKYHAVFSYTDNYSIINNKKISIDENIKSNLTRILRSWDKEYGKSRVIDVQEFNVMVMTTEGQERFHGKGVFPDNYEELLLLLGDLYDRNN